MYIKGNYQHSQQLHWWLSMKNEQGFPPKLLLPCREGCEDRKQGRERKKRSEQARALSRKQHKSQFSKSRMGQCELDQRSPLLPLPQCSWALPRDQCRQHQAQQRTS